MNFKLDSQTLSDLEVFHNLDGRSLFDLFNSCVSIGGKELLTEIMSAPSCDKRFLRNRIESIAYFRTHPGIAAQLDIDRNSLDFIEHYLNYYDYPTRKLSNFRAVEKAIFNKISPSNHYYIIERGIDYTVELLNVLHDFFYQLDETVIPIYLKNIREKVLSIFVKPEFAHALTIKKIRKLKAVEIASFDYLFRYTDNLKIRYLIDLMYYLDVLITVGKVAEKNRFSYPEISDSKEALIEAKNLFHPFVKNCIANDVVMHRKSNLLFVSGPNMSGKSTFLKSIGVSAYLAHIGFPVPAEHFKIGLLTGIYSTINLKDSLNNSYSHFYAEVKRIKDIASEIQKESNVLVIFDELFRGTNVKDAYEGSLAIISALAKTNNSLYVISTHILEVADQLNDKNIKYVYLETLNENGKPQYTYKVKDGTSNERLGMYIIRKEKIIEIINKIGS